MYILLKHSTAPLKNCCVTIELRSNTCSYWSWWEWSGLSVAREPGAEVPVGDVGVRAQDGRTHWPANTTSKWTRWKLVLTQNRLQTSNRIIVRNIWSIFPGVYNLWCPLEPCLELQQGNEWFCSRFATGWPAFWSRVLRAGTPFIKTRR